ncbi:thymidylate synthase [Marinovum sp.]|uniref:thymidylate synthase n=1 Tax=Marinovum sp. TaxID=2024839 RepID=UPI002B276B82|nr:thymidylate synthase [Marinovum sp.]
MNRFVVSLIAATALGACTGSTGKDNPFEEDPEDTEEPAAAAINEALASNLGRVSAPGGDTITVEITALDGTPLSTSFTRNTALDTNGYLAYTTQEDPLDRLFVVLAAASLDGSVIAGVATDGGQFNTFQGGGYYDRDGSFDPPALGNSPGEGQVSYAGNYAGLTNLTSSAGSNLLPVPPGTDPTLLPGEPSRVAGTIFLNANFADNAVNGAIYDRVLISSADGSLLPLDDLALLVSEIDANGEFFGEVEIDDGDPDNAGAGVGNYGGIFGGEDASSVAGLVSISGHIDGIDNEHEYGVFVLTQCGLDGDAAICDNVAPN